MSFALYGNRWTHADKTTHVPADWELESELEYWERSLVDVKEGTPSYEFVAGYRDRVQTELWRRRETRYPRAPRAFDLREIAKDVNQRVDLVALLDRYCDREQRSSGRTVKYRCFLHQDDTPSLVVWPEERRWWCFGCLNGYSAIDAYMKLENVGFAHATLALAKECGIAVPEKKRDGIVRLMAR
jgi:hypothetical protein